MLHLLIATMKILLFTGARFMKQLVWWLKPLALQAWNPSYVASQTCNVAKSFKFKSQYSHLSDEILPTSEWVLNEMIHVKHSTVRWHTGHSITTNSYEDMRMSAPVFFHHDLHVITTLCKACFFNYPISLIPVPDNLAVSLLSFIHTHIQIKLLNQKI